MSKESMYVLVVDEDGEPLTVVDCESSDTGYVLVDCVERKIEVNYYPADKIIKRS